MSKSYHGINTIKLIIIFSSLLLSIESLGFSSREIRIVDDFHGVGVTSLISRDGFEIIAGTKTGKIYRFIPDTEGPFTPWEQIEGYNSKFPIYSMAIEAESNHERIFFGGGDRYIAVWDRKQQKFVGRLGPHTGWVKDLAFDENSSTLFSIGCNCIEAWNCDSSSVSDLSKRSIENSVLASTLSSDLLNLCLVEDDMLVSCGVDGRLHVWSTDISVKQPLVDISPHEGRVNYLMYSRCTKTLFSIGNDGRLCAFQVSPDSIVLKSELSFQESNTRLTTGMIVLDDASSNHLLALGTTEGGILFVSVSYSDDAIEMVEIDRLELSERNKVYAFALRKTQCKEEKDEKISILCGHAKGMVEIEL